MRSKNISTFLNAKGFRALILSFMTVTTLGLVAQPEQAEAKWTRTHASKCMSLGGAPLDMSFAIWNNSTVSSMVLLCPISDTDYLLKGNLNTLNIHGLDANPTVNVDAMACRSTWWTTGGGCSPMVSSPTGTSDYTLRPNLSVWNGTTADFGYAWVRLPIKSGTSLSSLRGFYTSD